MADLRDFASYLDAFQRETSTPKSIYRRLICRGYDAVDLAFQNGAVAHYGYSSCMVFDAVIGQKKDKIWRTKRESFRDAITLSSANGLWERMLNGVEAGADPRFPFDEAAAEADFSQNLPLYDAVVADMLSPLVFHHAFESCRKVLTSHIRFDGHFSWRHGAWLPSGTPRTFGILDDKLRFFAPQTQISATLSFFPENAPHLRRFCTCASFENTPFDFSPIVESLKAACAYPLLAFDATNVDQCFLMPSAVLTILEALVPFFSSPSNRDEPPSALTRLAAAVPTSLRVTCDPYHATFTGKDGVPPQVLLDARAKRVERLVLLQNGTILEMPQTDITGRAPNAAPNGHAVDETGKRAAVFCPVLESNTPLTEAISPENAMLPERLSAIHPGKIACIEKISSICREDGTLSFYLPNGAILCQNGECLGHMSAPKTAFTLEQLLDSATVASNPIRLGSMAVPVLKLGRLPTDS